MHDREMPSSRLVSPLFRCLSRVATGLVMALVLSRAIVAEPDQVVEVGVWILAGIGGGALLAMLQPHPTRILGLVPYGATGLALGLALATWFSPMPSWLCVFLGVMGGMAYLPFLVACEARRESKWCLLAYVALPLFAALFLGSVSRLDAWPRGRWWFLMAVISCGAAIAWWVWLRDAYELTLEILSLPMYRVRGHGPGLKQIPPEGPLLIIANHAAWFDPIWVAKVLPRRVTGMLTSIFFDLPVLHFFATKVVPTIRVEDSRYRREAPELQQAVAALDRGESVLLFPEGQMRKREDKPLHPFGRGVWHILRERPATPVVVCWVEGGWGSFASYRGGPPAKHKRLDWWRRIDVAVSKPEVLNPVILQDHRATRNHLMRQVLDARKHLGLEPLRQLELAHAEERSA